MAKYRHHLPLLDSQIYACYTGMDTELLYRHGIDLPGFASYPLLAKPETRELIRQYYCDLIDLARENNVGVLLDSVTWVANRDRAAKLGISQSELKRYNIDAIELISNVRDEKGDLPTILSAQVGPRDDGYAPTDQMSSEEAAEYHSEQIEIYNGTMADVISAFTICYPEEASGIVRAAQEFNIPVVIAFTVETDGRLPTGVSLQEAIEQVDAETKSAASYYLINCAHPEHFVHIFQNQAWEQRIRGVVANASRKSHAELEVAENLDQGDPVELAQQIGELYCMNRHFNIVGGCCGSSLLHMKKIIGNVRQAHCAVNEI